MAEIVVELIPHIGLTDVPVINEDNMRVLSGYHWPGNVRERRKVMERSLMLWGGGTFPVVLCEPGVSDEDWSHMVRYTPGRTYSGFTDELTRFLWVEALRRSQGSKTEAAKLLNISRDAFYRYLRRLKIQS